MRIIRLYLFLKLVLTFFFLFLLFFVFTFLYFFFENFQITNQIVFGEKDRKTKTSSCTTTTTNASTTKHAIHVHTKDTNDGRRHARWYATTATNASTTIQLDAEPVTAVSLPSHAAFAAHSIPAWFRTHAAGDALCQPCLSLLAFAST